MGKKSKRKKHKYTKKDFIAIYCSQCKICKNNNPNPIFCYDVIYKQNPKKFSEIFKQLLKSGKWLMSKITVTQSNYQKALDLAFRETFCVDGRCKRKIKINTNCLSKNVCVNSTECFFNFKQQINSGSCCKIKKRKKNNRYIPEAYPTFFCNNGFKKEVMEIVNEYRNR